MRHVLVFLVAALIVIPAAAEVTVTPTRLRETRQVDLVKPDPDAPNFFNDQELEVTLKLSGPEMESATEYKRPALSEATDDTDASLIQKDQFGSNFQDIRRDTFGIQDKKKPPTSDFEVRLNLKVPVRKATMLKSVKGTIQLRVGGEKKEVLVKNASAMAGKAIEDPALSASKIGIKFANAKVKGSNPRELSLEITGDRTPIKSIEVIDAAGKVVSNGYSSFGFGEKTNYGISLRNPLDAKMSLRVNMVVGQKLIDVPFQIKDLPLP